MKKIPRLSFFLPALSLAALLAASGPRPLGAQPPGPPDDDHEEEMEEGAADRPKAKEMKHPLLDEKAMEKLSKRLELTEEQRNGFKAVLAKARPDLERKQAELKGAQEKMQAAVKAMQAAAGQAKESLRESLTLEQKEKFDRQWMQMGMRQMRQMRRQRMAGRGGPGMEREEEIEEEMTGPGGGRMRKRRAMGAPEDSDSDEAPGPRRKAPPSGE